MQEKFKIGGWSLRDLAVIGVLAALARALGLMTVFFLGGMNPVSLTLRAMIITVIFIILRLKVRAFGTLVLASLIGSLTSFFVMAQGILTLPVILLSAMIAEIFIFFPGRGKAWAIIVGTALLGLLDKAATLVPMWLAMRENPMMLWPLFIMVGVSGLGDILAAAVAPGFVKELRHAGFVNE
jgi:hypothetical protein